jgi:hypothetical protein
VKKLSGWARLWIVLALLSWIAAAGIGVLSWREYEGRGDRYAACQAWMDLRRAETNDYRAAERAYMACLRDDFVYAGAYTLYDGQLQQRQRQYYIAAGALGAFPIFLVLVSWISCWIRRGFQQQPN